MERIVTALLELSLPMAAVIALLLAAGPLLGRRFTAKWRWWAWLLLAVRLLVPVEISLPQPVLTLPQPQAEITYTLPQKAEPVLPGGSVSETPLQVLPGGGETLPSAQRPYEQLAQDTPQPAQTPQAAQSASAGTRTVPVMELVGWCWAAGAVLFLLWQLGSYLLLQARLRRSRRPVERPEVLALLAQAAGEAGVSGRLPGLYAAGVASPMIVGAVRPALLLPEMEWTPQQLLMVFRHELVHYRRHDIWYKMVLLLANAVHWFNPMVWCMVWAADRDLELSCDEAVVAGQGDDFREQYSRSLLAVMRAGANRRTLFTTNFSSGKKTLKQRFTTIFDRTKKKKGTVALAALLLAAALAGGLVACGTGERNTAVELTDYEALCQTYLAPYHMLAGESWSSPTELDWYGCLWFAVTNVYGYSGEGVLDHCTAYGIEAGEKRQALQELLQDGIYYLPAEALNACLTQYFDVTEELLNSHTVLGRMPDGTEQRYYPLPMDDRYYYANTVAYPVKATQEGNTLTLVYQTAEAAPGDEAFLAQYMASYIETHESRGRYALTIELAEDGSWKYTGCRYYVEELFQPRPEQVPVTDLLAKEELRQLLTGEYGYSAEELSGWQAVCSAADSFPYERYAQEDGRQYKATVWGEQQVTAYARPDGRYLLLYWEKWPEGFTKGENGEAVTTAWGQSGNALRLDASDLEDFDFTGAKIYLYDRGGSRFSFYSPAADSSLAVAMQDTYGAFLVKESGDAPVILTDIQYNRGSDWDGSLSEQRYYILGLNETFEKTEQGYYHWGRDLAVYDAQTHRMTEIDRQTQGGIWTLENGRDDGGALFALVEENAVRIYDPAWPQTPLAVYDSANLPLYGYDAVYVGGIYYDDRGGDLLALMYYPYDSGFTSNVEEGRYEVTDYLWRVAVLDKYSPGTPVRVLTMQQHPACNSQTTYPQGEVLLREGLLYYSNYYSEDGRHTLPNGETLRERWCFNLTNGASQRIETNEPGAVSYGEDFLTAAYAMGFTDEMLALCRESEVSADLVLSCTGRGRSNLIRYSPDGRFSLQSFIASSGGEGACSVVFLTDAAGTMRVIPRIWNSGLGSPFAYGFTSGGRVWVTDYEGTCFYETDALWNPADGSAREPAAMWRVDSLEPAEGQKAILTGMRGDRDQKCLVAYWAQVPADWDGWTLETAQNGGGTYHAVIFDENARLLGSWDTGIPLELSRYGGLKEVMTDLSDYEVGYTFFHIVGSEDAKYKLNISTGEVTRLN